ncbi:MAG: hypothetical protein QW574_05135 [Candidatus Nitrosocaldus sp.]
MQFDYEEFQSVEEVMAYLVTIAPLMKQVMTLHTYRGYTFALLPFSPLSGDHILMVYAKREIEHGLLEFDLSTLKYRKVSAVERADKNYFIVTTPRRNTLADKAIEELEKSISS